MLISLPRWQKQAIALGVDICLALIATWLAYSLRLDTNHYPIAYQWLPYGLSAVLFVPFFIKFGLYRAIFRYSGTSSLASTAGAVAAYGVFYLAILIYAEFSGVPRSVGILQPILFFSLVFGSRIFASQLLKRNDPSAAAVKNVIIYGAGEAGMQASRGLSTTPEYHVRGFLDDDPAKHGRQLNGREIFPPSRVEEIVERFAVTDILIALPSAQIERRRQIIDSLVDLKVRVRTIPGILDIARGEAQMTDLQELQIIDLLDRAPITDTIDPAQLKGKRVLVTGAGGSIGSELSRQLHMCAPESLVLFDHSEFGLYTIDEELRAQAVRHSISTVCHACLGSVRDTSRVSAVFSTHRPQLVFHAAAYKHVPLIESNEIEAATNNVIGTHNVAKAAQEAGTDRFTLISTDKAVRPTNIMGASKRLAEQVIQALAAQPGVKTVFSMVRFGNVLGSSGSVVPLFRRQIAAGGPLTVTDPEVTRYFMTIPEAVGLVLHASTLAEGGEVFVLDMGEPVKIIDLAKKMIRLSGKLEKTAENPEGDIEITSIGLRPGEKLYEELLIGENPQSTANPHIMMAREGFLPWEELEHELEELRAAVASEDRKRMLGVFGRTVSGFHRGENGAHSNGNAKQADMLSTPPDYSGSKTSLSGPSRA
ncbi:MAG: polysaccharide biosynthesis protein [Rhizobiaceae bacterium]|nr:polysaccharide biosynthesis protein [Rhizobiaceae bacterium]